MKKSAQLLFAFIFISVAFTGCKRLIIGNNEINEITFPSVAAIDILPDNKEVVKLTIADKVGTKVQSGGNGGSSGESTSTNVTHSEGRTVFEASRVSTSTAEKDIHWGHNEYIIIGEDAAKEDILKYLDFFIRNHESRLAVAVVVAKDSTGDEIIDKIKDVKDTPSGKIKELFDNSGSLSLAKETSLVEIFEGFDNKYSAVYIPFIHTMEKQHMVEDEKEENTLSLDGVAVFKGTKLLQYIIGDEARGLSWIKNEIRSAIIIAKDSKGESVSLEVVDSNAEIKTKFEKGEPKISIKVKVCSNIVELYGYTDVFKKDELLNLEKQQTEIVKKDIESVISFAQQNNVDILGFSDKLLHQHPVKWDKIKDKWDEVFPSIKVEVQVESNISSSYNIKDPVRGWEENKE